MLAVDPNLLAKSPIAQSPGSATASPWICCQIGGREHYAVPRALYRHGALEQMITDAWVRPGNPLGLLSAGLKARFHAELGKADVYGPAIRSMAFELRARRAAQAGWPLVMARNCWFQRVALSRLSQIAAGERAPILMSYSYAAAELFAFARRKGWRTVLGQIDPGPVEEEIVAGLHAAAPRTGGDWTRAPAAYWSEWRRECALADRIVVNSSWSRDALLQEGVPADKIRIVPLAYERPPESLAFRRRYPSSFSRTRPLRVLFLGQVNLRKGVEPLLDAIQAAEAASRSNSRSSVPSRFDSGGSAEQSPGPLARSGAAAGDRPVLQGRGRVSVSDLLGWVRSHAAGGAGLEASDHHHPVLWRGRRARAKWLDPARDHAAIHCGNAPRMPARSRPAAGGIGPQRRGREVWTC